MGKRIENLQVVYVVVRSNLILVVDNLIRTEGPT